MIAKRVAAVAAALLLMLSVMLMSGCSSKVSDEYESDTFQLGESSLGH